MRTTSVVTIIGFAAALLIGGCSVRERGEDNANLAAAARDAQRDIDQYAAETAADRARRQAAVRSGQPTARSVPSERSSTPAPALTPPSEDASAAPDADAARDVLVRYHDLIAAHRYGDAYALWDDGGRASGLSRAAFAAGFARYASYRATVGPPGRVDAGAGQRYVEVPVRVEGRLVDGAPFALAGSMTLHRTAAIDGATAEQRSWRIGRSELQPRPGATRGGAGTATGTTSEDIVTARYRCAGTTRYSVRFDNAAETATLRRDGRDVAVLDGQRPASGIWYKRDGYELRGKGRAADLTMPGRAAVACVAD